MELKIKAVDTSNEYQDVLKIRKKVFIDEQKISEKIEIDSNEKSSNYVIALINNTCLLCTSPSPRDRTRSRMPSSA